MNVPLRLYLSRTPPWMFAAGIVFGALLLWRAKHVGRIIVGRWQDADGFEYVWIAEMLASGYGFTFGGTWGWLGPYPAVMENYPSAWVDPLQVFIIAGSLHAFGEYGRLVLVLLNVLWLGCAAALIVRCCGPGRYREGVLAALLFLLLLVYVARPWLYIGNASLASFLFAVVALLLLRALERPSFRTTAALGTAIGVTNLAHAGSMLFGGTAAALLLFRAGFGSRAGWRHALLVAVLPIVIISPWTLRNYVAFQEVVPIRTGFGWNLYMGNPAVAMTFDKGAHRNTGSPPPWSASGAREAVKLLQNSRHERSLRQHAKELAIRTVPPGFEMYNEAQRDAYYASLSLRWMLDNPGLTSRLVLAKLNAFLFGWSSVVAAITLLAFLTVILLYRDPKVLALICLVMSFTVPYALAMPFYYRYRMPMEPFVFVLLGWCMTYANGLLLRTPLAFVCRSGRTPNASVRGMAS